ncbi:hypothetical protein EOD42_16705 [Rhodovarius crocodyli]|uniref:Uncharacterized protein n=1 Tax=Rhodovarius crocodyli TaxID=1979269 RepID=A0A437MC79_9PROT|nr:hypothetical protein [Rhodovarius crocodyli]RVT95225.1 hypothetical protein EOD42_16705 [Rhodovarius crocodyli]
MSGYTGRPWSGADDQALIAAYFAGDTRRAMAERFGRSMNSVATRILRLRELAELPTAFDIGASRLSPAADPPAGSPHPADAIAPPTSNAQAKVNPCEGRESGEHAGRVGAGHIHDRIVMSLTARGVPLHRAIREAELYRQRRSA